MSIRTQPLEFIPTTTFGSNPYHAPLLLPMSHGPAITPNGQTHARSFPVIAAKDGTFISYPPEHDEDDDEQLLYTYSSFSEEPITALAVNPRDNDTWSLCVEVPIPSIDHPTLLAVQYLIKYATTGDTGCSTIQTDTLLTVEKLPGGVSAGSKADLSVYKSGAGYAPRMVDHDQALCLSTTLAVKGNSGGDQWSHYIDNQHITPGVRVVDESYLYVVFHVSEYPTLKTIRSLSVAVSATWQKEEVEKKAKAEAERKEREEAERKAKEEAERRARWAEERKEREEARQARAEERQAREEAKRNSKASITNAPDNADESMQANIAEAMTRLGLEACPSGYAFVKTDLGYQCSAGGHKVTFEQLGMK